jgi:hypothetical protein
MKSIRRFFEQTYFGKLFRKDKFLFVVAFLFISFSLLANLIQLETSPFFVWNMYSERYYPQPEYKIYEVWYDNKLLNINHTWQSPEQVFLTEPLYNYLYAIKHGMQDPARNYLENYWAAKHPAFKSMVHHLYNTPLDYDAFPAWFKRYLSAVTGDSIKNIYVLQRKLKFEHDGRVSCLSSDTSLLIR